MDLATETLISSVCRNHYRFLMNLSNVVGVGCGYKFINGKDSGQPCIHVLVERKLNSNYVGYNNRIPKTYMGLNTDIVEIGKPVFRNLNKRIRPVQGGYSISPGGQRFFTGTLGCVVTKKSGKERLYFVLSNSHILSGENTLKVGTKIIQPAALDGGDIVKDKIGLLSKSIPIKFESKISSPVNYMDAAIAKLDDKSLASNLIALSGEVKGILKPSLRLRVKKTGATTGLTKGRIQTVNATIEVDTDGDGKKIALYKNQIISDIKNDGGDSGALVLDLFNNAVGLLFGGTDKSCIFTDIKTVLKAFSVEIYINQKP